MITARNNKCTLLKFKQYPTESVNFVNTGKELAGKMFTANTLQAVNEDTIAKTVHKECTGKFTSIDNK